MGVKRCKLSKLEYAAKECKGGDYVCRKCQRIAKKVKRLCEPIALKQQQKKK